MIKHEYTFRQMPEQDRDFSYKMLNLPKEQKDALVAVEIQKTIDLHNDMGEQGWALSGTANGFYMYSREKGEKWS